MSLSHPPRRPLLSGSSRAAALAALLLFPSAVPPGRPASQKHPKLPVDYVNPFIGTAAHGHTYPGASLPFGMVQLSPDTRVEGWDACSGYHYSDSTIIGFSHTHLSGTGVADYGDVLFMPTIGPLRITPGTEEQPWSGYRSRFRHSAESASAGYYSVLLDDYGILVELTVTERVGLHRYTFPRSDSASIVIDLLHGLGPDKVIDSWIEFVGESEIVGFRRSRGWAEDQHLYFAAEISKPFRAFGTVVDDRIMIGSRKARGMNVKGFIQYGIGDREEVLVKVALSSVSVEGARKNLRAEVPHWDFDGVRRAARERWNKELSRIEIDGGSESQRTVFYTALYRTLLSPNVFADVDGRYRGLDRQVHTARGYTRYTVFSLWDTFRATHPLFTIVEPERTVDFIKSFLAQYDEGGLLPVWELAGNETWTMIGYHSVPVIVDAFIKGIRSYDVGKAYSAINKSAGQDHFGLKYYRAHGHIPADKEHESVSKTLEYAYDDWCVAVMADALGKSGDVQTFSLRAQSYRNLFDPSTGFMRPRRNGAWSEPFDPYAVTNDYTEANAWQYTFFVPHDVGGMIELMGGDDAFVRKLDELFTTTGLTTGRQQADITGMIGQYAHGNEPSHHVAYLYAYAGAPWKTQERVREIMETLYTDGPDGLPGNEDCGQMSAWYVMSALGFYQVSPGLGIYTIGSPLFPKATIRLSNGRAFTVRAPRTSREHCYVQSARLNGAAYGKSYLRHEDILNGSDLTLEMASKPTMTWGVERAARPFSILSTPSVVVPIITSPRAFFQDSVKVTITGLTPGAAIHFTLDGSAPTKDSPRYEWPFTLTESTTVKAIAVRRGLPPSGIALAEFRRVVPIGTVALHTEYSPHYTAGGDQALVDQVRGTVNFRTGGWQGYEQNDLIAVVDLGSRRRIGEISTGFLQDINAWIFFPTSVEYAVSNDGVRFRTVGRLGTGVPPDRWGEIIKEVTLRLAGVRARYVRVHAKNIGTCPPWHKGGGNKAWLFVDEIIVR